MYTPNHAMIPISPPFGTQLVGTIDGKFMFIFDRSIRQSVCTFLEGLLDEARAVGEKAPSVETTPTEVTQGKVIVGDVVFPMVPAAPVTEPEYVGGKQVTHIDAVSAYPAELTKLDETVHVDADVIEHMEAANKRGQHRDTDRPTEPQNETPAFGDF